MALFFLQLTSSEASFEYSFSQDFLDKKYEIALVNFVIDGKASNRTLKVVDTKTNKFAYSVNRADKNGNPINETNDVDIPIGKYDFSELVTGLKALLKKRDKNSFEINIENDNVIIDLKKGYSIDFTIENSCSNFFGFENEVVKPGKHKLSNAIAICEKKYDSIFVWCNLIGYSYVNDRKLNSIYRFRHDFEGDYVFIEPSQLVYHNIVNTSNKITIKLVDNNNKQLTLMIVSFLSN